MNKKRLNRVMVRALTGALVSSAGMVPGAYGAEPTSAKGMGLEEVVVTARRKEENLQTVPVAVTALTQSDFNASGAFSGQQLGSKVPGLHVSAQVGDRNNLVYSIRGQGQTYGTEYPSVISYFSEIPLPRLSTGQFFDLQNVQVLRGPQGTLFGRVTDGGAVLIQPQKPTDDFGGYAQLKGGNYSLKQFEGALNLPIVSDKVLLRVAMEVNRRDGYTHDRVQNLDVDDVHYESYRAGLTLRPFSGFENYTVVSYYHADENGTASVGRIVAPVLSQVLRGGLGQLGAGALAAPTLAAAQAASDANTAAGPRSSAMSTPMFSKRRNILAANITTFELAEDLTLKSILGYSNIKEQSPQDFDGLSLALIDPTETVYPNYWTEQMSEEFQLQGKSFNRRLDWTAGLYTDYLHPGGKVVNQVTQLLLLSRYQESRNTDRSYAAYLQGTYDLSDAVQGLKLTAGGRYTRDKNFSSTTQTTSIPIGPGQAFTFCGIAAGASNCTNTFESQQSAFTWTLGLDYQITPDALVYFANRRGYKGGGFNQTYTTLAQAPYKAEFIRDYELGLKADWNFGDAAARTNIAVFRANESAIQRLVTFVVNGSPNTYVSNAADAVVQGVEFEGTLIPIKGLELTARYAYTDASYDTANAAAKCAANTTVPSFCPYNDVQNTPKQQVTFDAHYGFALGSAGDLRVGGSYFYQTEVALTDSSYPSKQIASLVGIKPGAIEPSYHLINLDASLANIAGQPFDFSVFVTNVSDKLYRVGVNDLSYNFGTISSMYGEPRMWGAALKYRF